MLYIGALQNTLNYFLTDTHSFNCPWEAANNYTGKEGLHSQWFHSSILQCRPSYGLASIPHCPCVQWYPPHSSHLCFFNQELVDWRLGLSLYHLKQARVLFDEAQVGMLLEQHPDPEFIKVQTQLFINLSSTGKKLLETRAKSAAGVAAIASKATMGSDTSAPFTYKGQTKGFAEYHPIVLKAGYSSDKIPSSTITNIAAPTRTAGTAASAEVSTPPAPPLPPLPSLPKTGEASSSTVIISSDSDIGSPAPIPVPVIVPTSAPIENSQIVKIATG